MNIISKVQLLLRLGKLHGLRSYSAAGVSLAVALYQAFVGPIPGVDPAAWAIIYPLVAAYLRKDAKPTDQPPTTPDAPKS